MKTVRYLAASLMVFTSVLHVITMLMDAKNPNALPMLLFGIAYLTIGVLLFMDKQFSQVLGTIIPLIGFGIGVGVIGVKNWDTVATIMFLIDAIVVICCVSLLFNRKKVATKS